MDGGEMAQFIQFSRFESGNKKYQNVLLSWWIFFSALLEFKSFLVLEVSESRRINIHGISSRCHQFVEPTFLGCPIL
jgi:hypothetical protein